MHQQHTSFLDGRQHLRQMILEPALIQSEEKRPRNFGNGQAFDQDHKNVFVKEHELPLQSVRMPAYMLMLRLDYSECSIEKLQTGCLIVFENNLSRTYKRNKPLQPRAPLCSTSWEDVSQQAALNKLMTLVSTSEIQKSVGMTRSLATIFTSVTSSMNNVRLA